MKRSVEGTGDGYPKRQKADVSESKVLHVRGVPPDTHESELHALVVPFGTLVRALIVGPKRQAFIELDSVLTAQKLIAHYSMTSAIIRGSTVAFQYSDKTEVRPNPRYPGSSPPGPGEVVASFEEKATPVLLASIMNCRLPVTIDNLYQVFRTFGDVLRIVTFQKKSLQALVEYPNASVAAVAKRNLEGKDIFQGCCTLHISFSSTPPPLQVKSDQTRARDFTTGSHVPLSSFGGYGGPQGFSDHDGYGFPSPPSHAPFFPQPPPLSGPIEGSVLLVNGLPEGKVSCDMIFTLFGVYGDVIRVKILWNKKDTALVQFTNPSQAGVARQHLDQVPFMDHKLSVSHSKNKEIAPPMSSSKFTEETTKDYTGSPLHRYSKPGSRNERHICPPSLSIHVSNLPDEVNPEELKQFFAADDSKVQGVKVFGDKKKMAFVSYATIADAINALIRFHNANYGDRHIKITFSHAKNS